MRRAKAAAERLCILVGDEYPWERRDASLLLWHTGQACQAATELEAYESSSYYRTTAKAGEKGLVERLLTLMQSHPGAQLPPMTSHLCSAEARLSSHWSEEGFMKMSAIPQPGVERL